MRERTSKWIVLAGSLAIGLGLSVSVSAQPTTNASDAGAPKPQDASADGSSAANTTPSDASTSFTAPMTTGDDGGVAPPTPTFKKPPPPPPPPTPAQVAALETLQKEADAFDQGARDYRDTVTTIIKLHYEEKKKNILSGLDREIAIEREELCKARETAISRLEEFTCQYAGADPGSSPPPEPLACKKADGTIAPAPAPHLACTNPYRTDAPDPETPDAMYRLAALYEERARSDDAKDDVSVALKPAIALYKRVIKQFPSYKELAAIYYYLGHAYNDSGRMEEGQQVWRSLVCHNKYPYPTKPDAKNPDVDSIMAMEQDHPTSYWNDWRNRYSRPGMDPKKLVHNDETIYKDPYGDDCKILPQPNLRTGEDPKYVAEVWWQVGNWEFDQLDSRAGVTDDEPVGVWDLNRAASAYTKALKFKRPPLYSVSLYKYAWTVFKQQRYDAATRQFVALLLHTDDLEKQRGDANVSDFRSEAYTYIAGSLTNVDFLGPSPEEPYIQRPDVVDSIPDPVLAEKALHVAIDRLRDPTLIPQDKPWTIEIYKALAAEFRSLNQFNNAIEVYTLMLQKWPMDPTAPEVQYEIALTYDQMGMTGKHSPAERDALAAKALDARTNLANYVGTTPWVDANKDNPEAIHNAERLAHGGLRSAAAAHTNNGKQLLVLATQAGSEKEALEDLSRSLAEYKLAAIGWSGYLSQPETQSSPDAYESRFWLADALNKQVKVQTLLHSRKREQFPEPTFKEIDMAKTAAIDVRDSNEDDKYLTAAAQFVVEESDVLVDQDNAHYADSKGSFGYPKRTELETEGTGDNVKVKQVAIPANLLLSMKARDEYVAHVPPEKDSPDKTGVLNSTVFAYDVADIFFVYGDFTNAKARFEPIYRDHCGKDEYGQKAWIKLISMAAKQNDAARARQLAEADKAHSCAVGGRKGCTKKADCGTDEDCTENQCRSTLSTDIFQAAGYQDADKKFIEACGRDLTEKNPNDKCDPVTDANKPAWKDTAKLYNDALQAAPGRREAPRAAMRAAYAFKQLGDYNSAIKAYEQFIAEYGKEEKLKELNGEKKGVPSDEKQYKERLAFLNIAYDELGTTFYSFFNYTKAAETYERIAQLQRFTEDKRKTAAKNAMILFNAIGDRPRMLNMYKIVVALHPTADEKANYDYLVSSFDYEQWNPVGDQQAGANRNVRQNAELAMAGFYGSNKSNSAAAKYSLEAAWRVAKMKKSGGDVGYHQWFTNTIAAWQFLNAHATTNKDGKESDQQPYTDYGAEAEYTLLDEEIHDKYDGKHNYSSMNSEQILGKIDQKTGQFVSTGAFKADVATADSYDVKLKHIVETYHSLEFNPASLARSGTLYDSLRTGLYACAGKAFNDHLIPPQFKTILEQMRKSGHDDLVDKADQLTDMVKDGWKNKRGREMEAIDEVMVRNYAKAIQLARTYNTKNPTVTNAIARLAFFTDSSTELGEGPKACIPPPKGATADPPGQGTGPGHMCGLAAYVNNTGDPTDSAKPPTRKLSYAPQMYLQMRPGLPAVMPENGAALPLPVGVQ